MLTKLIDGASFFHQDEQLVTILDFTQAGFHLKKADTDSRINEYASTIEPQDGKIYVHMLCLGAGEYFGANRNADYFPEENLLRSYKTFETSPAHIFRNHVNKDPKIAVGKVIFAIYNERMHRVECIAELWPDRAADIIERVQRGEFPKTSMACKVASDTCSICGNVAKTRQEYCDHLNNELGRIYADGRKVMALNVEPLKFFDMSIVVRPADVTSSILQKVASTGAAFADSHVIGSVDIAEAEGLDKFAVDKTAAIKKLSEIIKEVDGEVTGIHAGNLDSILAKTGDPKYRMVNELAMYKLEDALETMAELGISPSVSFLANLVAAKYHPDFVGSGDMVESLVKEIGIDNMEIPELSSGGAQIKMAQLLSSDVVYCSLFPQYVEKRATFLAQSNMGYVGNGPIIAPNPYEEFKVKQQITDANQNEKLFSMLKKFLTIGGLALAAKAFITRAIEAKMKTIPESNDNSGVKIILVKSASEYRLTNKLAKASLKKALR